MNHIYINIYVDNVKFYIVCFEKNERRKIKDGEITLPLSFSMGDRLYYIKKMINTIIEQYSIEGYNIQLDNDIGVEIVDAVKIEGILEELFSSKGVMLWK